MHSANTKLAILEQKCRILLIIIDEITELTDNFCTDIFSDCEISNISAALGHFPFTISLEELFNSLATLSRFLFGPDMIGIKQFGYQNNL